MDWATVFQAFLPCFVVLLVGLAALLIMRVSPPWLYKILNFNFTNPKPKAKPKRR